MLPIVKNLFKPVILYFAAPAAAVALAVTGCASPPGLTPVTSQQTVLVTNLVNETNFVQVTNVVVQTNVQGVLVTNTVTNQVALTNQVEVVKTNVVTVTNGYTVSAGVSNALSVAGAVNSLSAPINPFSGALAGILGLFGGVMTFYANSQTKKLQQHQTAAQTIITAVEGLAPAAAAGVKAAVQDQALKMGTTNEVDSVVQAVTQNLPTTASTT